MKKDKYILKLEKSLLIIETIVINNEEWLTDEFKQDIFDTIDNAFESKESDK